LPEGDIVTWYVRLLVMPDAAGAPTNEIVKVACSLGAVVNRFATKA
jgi:hypothetical protein